MVTLLAFVFVLGVLVFVHELGHFLAAKRVGIRVLKFQLGFNPTIASFRRGDTGYGIGALPLGGYVKMAGESPDEPRTGRSDEFLSKTKWQRFQVLIMGPAMNIGLAFVLTAVVLYQGAEVPAYDDALPVVGAVTPGSVAAGADIKPGDRIVSVSDRRVDTWEQFFVAIGSRPNQTTSLVIERRGQQLDRTVTPTVAPGKSRFEIGEIGVLPDVHPHIPSVNPGEPGERAGIKPGDVILAIDGEPIIFQGQLVEAISKRPEQQITIDILRGGERLQLHATPERRGQRGWLGVLLADETKSVRPGAVDAVRMSFKRNVEY